MRTGGPPHDHVRPGGELPSDRTLLSSSLVHTARGRRLLWDTSRYHEGFPIGKPDILPIQFELALGDGGRPVLRREFDAESVSPRRETRKVDRHGTWRNASRVQSKQVVRAPAR